MRKIIFYSFIAFISISFIFSLAFIFAPNANELVRGRDYGRVEDCYWTTNTFGDPVQQCMSVLARSQDPSRSKDCYWTTNTFGYPVEQCFDVPAI